MVATPPSPPPPARKRATMARIAGIVGIAFAVVAALTIAGAAFLGSRTALELAVRTLVGRSDGRLAVDEASGSLLSSVRVKRLSWRGSGATVVADDVALEWTPAALASRGIVVKGLGAQRIAIEIEASDTATSLPPTLALPTDVVIDRLAVANFEWKVGTSSGAVTGIEFGYRGNAKEHHVDALSLVTQHGTVKGKLALKAEQPYAIDGALDFAGDASLYDARAQANVSGTLAAIALEAATSAHDARGTLSARLTPLAATPLAELALDFDQLDLAAWDATLPQTRLKVTARATPAEGGLAGQLDATNAIAGAIDRERLPIASITTRFTWRDDALALEDFAAEFVGGGRASGSAQIPLTGTAGQWKLDVRDLDIRALHSALVATRLSGTLDVDLASERQRIRADIADRTIARGIGLALAATVAEGSLAVERFRVQAAGGELAGSGRIALSGDYAFRSEAKARGLDPSRFGAFPRGRLDGNVTASGVLKPAWRVATNVTVAAGSRLEGVALEGNARGNVSRGAVRDAVVDLKLASAKLSAHGDAGIPNGRLGIELDAPRLAELAPILPARVPRPLGGTLAARVVLSGDLAAGGVEFTVRGQSLKAGPTLAAASIEAHGRIAPATATRARSAAAERALDVTISASDLVVPQGTFARARANGSGTLAQHGVTLAVVGTDFDISATAHGALRTAEHPGAATTWQWSGTIDTLENRGPWAMRLTAPAALEFGTRHVHVGATSIDVADGKVALASLAWDEGRLSTRGRFSGVPVATLAHLSGAKMPFESTMTLTGEWSLAATPRLNGSLRFVRERGDLAFGPESSIDAASRPLRITAAEVSARVRDDAVEATALVRSERGANLDARLAIGVAPGAPPGRLAKDAPLELAVKGEVTTLQVLQPWVGTVAIVNGRLSADVVARGTVANAPLSGSLSGTALRVDAPQYGVHFTDGRLDAHLANGTLTVDALSFTGGAGRFEASGTLVTGEEARFTESTTGTVKWRAERFRVLNRPDRKLVASGAGTLALKNRRLSLEGTLAADEGHFEYTPDPSNTLGDDVVVKGRPARAREGARDRLPVTLDLDLDFGNRFTFSGEGLDTGLAGKVHVTTAADGRLRGRGSIRATNGSYYAFGQKLAIDRGRLIFDGPLDNPGLDIVALRKNLAVEAGVIVTGTVKVPIVQLTSEPPVPDNEKLSWLVLGQGLDRTSGTDMAALQAASAALFGSKGKPLGTQIANRFGIDDISVKSASGTARGGAAGTAESGGQVVAIGKRLSDRLSLIYEQGLTVASNALKLEYRLTRTLTLRAEAGAISGFGVYYRRSFD